MSWFTFHRRGNRLRWGLLAQMHTARQGHSSGQADPKAHLTDGRRHQLLCCSWYRCLEMTSRGRNYSDFTDDATIVAQGAGVVGELGPELTPA